MLKNNKYSSFYFIDINVDMQPRTALGLMQPGIFHSRRILGNGLTISESAGQRFIRMVSRHAMFTTIIVTIETRSTDKEKYGMAF